MLSKMLSASLATLLAIHNALQHRETQMDREQEQARVQALEELCGLALQAPDKSLLLFTFPDGSHLGVSVQAVINQAAKRLCVGDVSADVIVAQQLMPALDERPGLLAEFAQDLTMDSLYLLATTVNLRAPAALLRETYTMQELRILLALPKDVAFEQQEK